MLQRGHRWQLTPAQRQQIAEALKVEGERGEEILGRVEDTYADYRAAAEAESPQPGKERNSEREGYARQLRLLEAAARQFQEALSALGREAEEELRKEYRTEAPV
jgi:hypothetical protein